MGKAVENRGKLEYYSIIELAQNIILSRTHVEVVSYVELSSSILRARTVEI